jgi:hypothetical protein
MLFTLLITLAKFFQCISANVRQRQLPIHLWQSSQERVRRNERTCFDIIANETLYQLSYTPGEIGERLLRRDSISASALRVNASGMKDLGCARRFWYLSTRSTLEEVSL